MGRLTAIVLGAAAGGGFPQWNCRCPTCRLAWGGDPRVRPRTQASLAVSADGENWLLINASPDLPQQLRQSKALHPRAAIRGSPIKAVVLTGAEIDQVAGLLSLREREAFELYATAITLAALADNPIFSVLASDLVKRNAVVPGAPLMLAGGLQAELFLVPGKAPLYLEGENPETAVETPANVGVELAGNGAHLSFIPGAAAITPAMRTRLARADVILFDGTLFRDDEMIATGTGSKTGRRMGHMPIAGPNGSMRALTDIAGRRLYVHINNTNPILIAGSLERCEVERAGWEIAEDGMEIVV
ncbi:MAG TPA: pyrroloquinoline quinone biosynthesis protein PqqB [Xanthobacteraceae bacterium]